MDSDNSWWYLVSIEDYLIQNLWLYKTYIFPLQRLQLEGHENARFAILLREAFYADRACCFENPLIWKETQKKHARLNDVFRYIIDDANRIIILKFSTDVK